MSQSRAAATTREPAVPVSFVRVWTWGADTEAQDALQMIGTPGHEFQADMVQASITGLIETPISALRAICVTMSDGLVVIVRAKPQRLPEVHDDRTACDVAPGREGLR